MSNTSALIEGFSQSILQVASHSTGYSQLAFGDQDDGFDGGLIYSNASRYLAIEAANVERMRFTSTGNVGIGTTAPTEKLEVVGYAKASTGFKFGNYGLVYDSSNDVNIKNAAYYHINFHTNNTQRMRITNAGDVGIGTSVPTEKLDVIGNIKLRGTNNLTIGSTGSGGDFSLSSGIRGYNFSNNNGDLLRIDSTGNIGIGTTAPTRNLEIVAQDGAYLRLSSANTDTSTGALIGSLEYKSSDSDSPRVVSSINSIIKDVYGRSADLIFSTAQTNQNNAERMRITDTGNVGIGTASPAAKLDVNGTTYLRSVALNTVFGYSGNNIQFINTGNTTFAGNVGIGTTAPTEKLEVAGKAIIRKSGTATPHGDTDFFVSDSTAALSTAQMQILSGNNASSILYFSDTDAYNIGGIKYSHSDNSMHLRVNGSDRMHITSTGNVGIGTTTPSALLEIKSNSTNDFLKLTTGGGGATPVKLIFEKTVNEQGIIEYNRNGNLEIYNTDGDGGVLISGSGSANADMYVNHAGKVGIGTTAPAAKLHVAGEIRVNAGQPVMLDAANNIYAVAAQNQFRLYSGGSPAINVTTSGNVGIGTTAPAYKLDVNGDARVDSYLRFSSAGTYLRNNSSGALVLAANSGYIETGWGARFRVRAQSGSDTIMLYGGGDSYINGGNLGIGTTAPDSKLHVSAASGIAFKVNPNNVDKEWYIDTTNPDHLKKEGNLILNADPTGVHTSTKISFNIDGSNKASINSDGDLGVGTTAQTSKVHVDGTAMRQLRMGTAGGPSSNTDTSGAVGDMAYDDNYFYIKTASGWGRVQLDFGF